MTRPGARVPPQGEAVQRLPTLTEVIEADAVFGRPAVEPVEAGVPEPAAEVSAPSALPTESELSARVLADVQRQVELMLEHRLREALMPALLRATDTLVLQARTELAMTLRDVVSRAVVRELARHR